MGNDTVTPNTPVTRDKRGHPSHPPHLKEAKFCPHGGLGPMLGSSSIPTQLHRNTPHAANMTSNPCRPIPCMRYSPWQTGLSYTAPMPQVHFLQQLGLACTKAFAAHLRRQSRQQSSSPTQAGPNSAPPPWIKFTLF